MIQSLFYDPTKTFDDNLKNGPFNMDSKDYRTDNEPKYNFLGQPINAPFGIAAGSLSTSRHTDAAFRLGYDVVCYKTQRSVTFPVNLFPNVLPLGIDGDLTLEKMKNEVVVLDSYPEDISKLSITNSFAVPSRDPDFWVEDLKKALLGVGTGQLLIMSVVGTIQNGFGTNDYYDDFANVARLAANTGVKAVEVNLSCPNVASEGVICYSSDAVYEICKRSKEAIGNVPLVVKIGYYSAEQQSLLEEILRRVNPFVSAVSAINTLKATIVDKAGNQALPGKGRQTSGVCGASIKWAGLDMVKRLDVLRKDENLDYEIIGVGGVMVPDDYFAYRNAGADCVQSVTGAMWNQYLAQEIKKVI